MTRAAVACVGPCRAANGRPARKLAICARRHSFNPLVVVCGRRDGSGDVEGIRTAGSPDADARPVVTCPTCQSGIPEGARFCPNCGSQLAPRSVEGERRLATLLFADVVGSTTLAERLDPEVWAEIMQGAYDFMTKAVSDYGGTVTRYVGDEILAIFGAPIAHEDDAERAVRAALAIQEQAADYAARLLPEYGLDFMVRIGVNTGLVVLARVGDKESPEAMGDVPNVAARLQSLAAPGSVLIGGDTYQHVKHLVEATAAAEVSVKGRSAPVSAYKIVGLKVTRGSQRGLDGITSPLVGREVEFRRLHEAVSALREGTGSFITVVGEAGLGKSRLVAELQKQVRDQMGPAIRWFEGRCLSYTRSSVYFPWQQVIRASIGARDGKPAAEVRALLQHHRSRRGLPADALPFLEQTLSVESDASRKLIASLDGEVRVERLNQALRAHLASLANAAPTVVVFEDLHWADQPTIEALISTAPLVAESKILILCLLRPDHGSDNASWKLVEHLRRAQPGWADEICLEPLGVAQSKELLGNLLYIEDLPETVRGLILSRSEGNPFFIEEVIRALIDSGHIVEEAGHWRALAEIDKVSIPNTLLGVLSARIDRLPETTRQVIQAAAVIGRAFPHRVLSRVCDEGPPHERITEVDPHLGVLSREELVRERTREPELEYVFKHALTQEAAYDRLLLKRRRELHRRTAKVLEAIHQESTEHAALLAYHFISGEDWEGAARYSMLAGERSSAIFALDEALKHYQTAVDALERLPEVPPDRFIEAILAWNEANIKVRNHEQLGPRQEMLTRLSRAEQLARELGDKRNLARVLVAKGNVYSLSGMPGEGFPALLEANEMADELGDESLFLLPFFATTEAMVAQDPRRAIEQFEQVIGLARKHRNYGILAHAMSVKAVAHARLGQFDAARAALDEALALVPRSRSLIKEADVHLSAGIVYYEMGELDTGLSHVLQGLKKALDGNGLECACAGYFFSGMGRMQSQELEQALQDFQYAARLGENLSVTDGMDTYLNLIDAGQALVRAVSGDAQAIPELERTLANARKLQDEYGIAYLAHALGDARSHFGDPEAGRPLLVEALEYYRRHGMKPYVARVLRSLAAGYEAQGRFEEANPLREEADGLSVLLRQAPMIEVTETGPTPTARLDDG